MFAVITQEESEPKLLPNANPTMPPHFWIHHLFPSFLRKSYFRVNYGQRKKMYLPLNLISSKFLVTFVVPPALGTTDATLLLPNPMATRKKTRPSNPKRRLDKPNILAFPRPKLTARRLFNWQILCASSI
jgi:hypothetical protein